MGKDPKRRLNPVLAIILPGTLTVLLLVSFVGHLGREGIVMFRRGETQYYRPAELTNLNLPEWHVTNSIPLSPDQAVAAAVRYASNKHPEIVKWEVDSISLRKETGAIWVYNISLIDRGSGRYETEVVRVLMNGSIWKPWKEILNVKPGILGQHYALLAAAQESFTFWAD